jgi:hypothetical protein
VERQTHPCADDPTRHPAQAQATENRRVDVLISFLHNANLIARLALEAAALLTLSYWGLHLDRHTAVRIGMGIAAPLTAAVVWALYASPNTAIDVAAPLKVAIQLVVFAVAAGALAHTGKPRLAATFAALAVANTALITIWGQ